MNRIKICYNFSDSTQIKMKDNYIGNKTKETQICFKGYYVINLRNNINFSYLTNLYFQFFFFTIPTLSFLVPKSKPCFWHSNRPIPFLTLGLHFSERKIKIH